MAQHEPAKTSDALPSDALRHFGKATADHAKAQRAIAAPNDPRPHATMDRDTYKAAMKQAGRLPARAWKHIVARVWYEIFANALLDRGATMSYFTVLTAVPALLVLVATLTLVLSFNEAQVLDMTGTFIQNYLPEEWGGTATTIVHRVVGSVQESTILLIGSALVAMFSASAYVRAFSRSANAIYGRIEGRSLLRTWATMWAITVFLLITGTLIMVGFLLTPAVIEPLVGPAAERLGVEGFLQYLLDHVVPVWSVLRWPVTLLLTMLLIGVLYHFAPNVRPGWFRLVTVGNVFALCGAILAWFGVSKYVEILASTSTSGAMSTAVAALLAIWLMNCMLLVGMKIDAEVTRAKELLIGIKSERMIHIPPSASPNAMAHTDALGNLIAQGKELRRAR